MKNDDKKRKNFLTGIDVTRIFLYHHPEMSQTFLVSM